MIERAGAAASALPDAAAENAWVHDVATQLALRDWPLAPGVKPRAQVLLVDTRPLSDDFGKHRLVFQQADAEALQAV